MQFLIF